MSFTLKAHQRKNGLWEVKGVDPHTGLRKSYYDPTPEGAIAKATKYNSDTLIGFYESAYLPTIRHLSVNYNHQVAYLFEKYIAPAFGDTALDAIERNALQRHFNNLKLSPRSLKLVKHVLGAILRLAEEDGLVVKNVAKGVRLPRPQATKQKALIVDDLRTLLEYSAELREFVLLTGCAGLRMGEALGAGSNQMDGDILRIEQQVQRAKGGKSRIQTELKTKASYREIPIPFDLPKSVFFCPQKPQQAQYQLRRLCTSVGQPVIGPHALRHTFITILEDELECPRRVVQALAGHAGREITDGYSRVSLESKRKWMELYWNHISTGACRKVVVQPPSGNLVGY